MLFSFFTLFLLLFLSQLPGMCTCRIIATFVKHAKSRFVLVLKFWAWFHHTHFPQLFNSSCAKWQKLNSFGQAGLCLPVKKQGICSRAVSISLRQQGRKSVLARKTAELSTRRETAWTWFLQFFENGGFLFIQLPCLVVYRSTNPPSILTWINDLSFQQFLKPKVMLLRPDRRKAFCTM